MFKKLKFKWQFLLFTGIAALFCIIALLTNIFDHPTFSNSLLFFDRSDTFMDFFNTLFDSTQPRPYDKGTIYPAFCYLIYELMASFVSPSELSYGGFSIRISQEGMMIFAVYTAITCTALFMLLFSMKSGSKAEKLIFLFFVFFSAPFLYLLERGNIIVVSFIFILLFFALYGSDSAKLREISYLCLAASVCIKIYPVIFGLIILFDKRYRDAVRCIIYGIIMFVIPFAFYGGFSSIIQMVNNVFDESSLVFNSFGYGYLVGYKAITVIMVSLLLNMTVRVTAFSVIATYLISALCIASAFFIRDRWKKVLALTVVVCGFPDFSYEYALIFMFLPILLFLNEDLERNPKNILYTILMVMCTVYIPYYLVDALYWINGADMRPIVLYCFINGVALLLLSLLVIYDGARSAVSFFKTRKAAGQDEISELSA